MNILVTGGAGFIGSHLVEELLKTDNRVVVIDNFHNFYSPKIKVKNILESINKKEWAEEVCTLESSEESIKKLVTITESKNFKLYYEDIRDIEKMDEIFLQEKIDVVVNLGGLAGVRPSIDNPLFYEDVNIRGYMNLLEMCVKYKIKKFVQASSSSVYGDNKKVPFREDDIVDFPISHYAGTKKACEIMGHTYHKIHNIDMVQLRFFTVYGERQRPDLAIHKFVKNILAKKEIAIYGDGSSARDYTYVKDIVDGIIKSIDYLLKNRDIYEIINLGNSRVIPLLEMVEVIEKELGVKAYKKFEERKVGDVLCTYADITKAKNLLGYEPKVDFENGIKRFVDWYKKGEM